MGQWHGCARMAELADAPDSKSGSRKRVGVRPSLWAPSILTRINQDDQTQIVDAGTSVQHYIVDGSPENILT